jgi:lysophospholipase L1-like esterase
MIVRVIALTCALVVAGLVPAFNQQPTAAQSEQVYLALGDSIPAGLLASRPNERGYPAVLRDLMEAQRLGSDSPGNVELINLSEPGETIESFVENGQLDEALSEIDELSDDRLRTITLTIGGNNILALWESTPADRADALDTFETGFAEVVEELEAATAATDVDIVVTTYYDLTEGDASVEGTNAWWLSRFNDVIRDTADDAGFTVVDLAEVFQGQIPSLTWFPADIHPNNTGHQLIARAIWQSLAYDGDAPEIEIVRPDSDEARSRTPTIHATVTDNVGIESVVLEIDDEPVAELLYVADRDQWIGVWDARTYSGSSAEITVRAVDVSSNEATDSVTVSLPSR